MIKKSLTDGPYNPERDLFRLIKYETYCILDLYAYTPELVPENELTDKELELVEKWYNEQQPLTFEEAFGD